MSYFLVCALIDCDTFVMAHLWDRPMMILSPEKIYICIGKSKPHSTVWRVFLFLFWQSVDANLSYKFQGQATSLLSSVWRQFSLWSLRVRSEARLLPKGIGIWGPSFMGRWSLLRSPVLNEPWLLLSLCALQGYEDSSLVSPCMMHISAKAV